jgi:hypothetical protein
MQNRTVGIIVTVITAGICGCLALFSCIWGALVATGTPINVTGSDGITTPQTFPQTIGYVLLCLSFLMILVPVAVGFFTLRKKPVAITEALPPTS